MEEAPTVSLATLAQGGAGELWQRELAEVLKNIADQNTDPKTKREINLKVTIQPNDEREIGDALVSVTSKVAAVRRLKTVLYFGRREGRLVAVESNPKQQGLFDQRPPGPVAMPAGGKEPTKP